MQQVWLLGGRGCFGVHGEGLMGGGGIGGEVLL